MKDKLLKTIIFIWTILSLLIDTYFAIKSGATITGLIISLIIAELVMCWIAYQMLSGKYWALIILILYYGLRSFNIYTNSFSFYTKSGLNMEINLGKFIGINLVTLLFFILLIKVFIFKSDNTSTKRLL
jgi:hypothetical protein